MNAPPFPINPEVGEWSGNWVWNGARWVATPTTGLRVLTRTFAASGPYMPSPGLASCVVECFGAGGAGGSLTVPFASSWCAGSGGGAGGYSRITLPAALVRGGVLVTIAPGSTQSSPIALNPTYAGDTAFGALCLAHGGGNAWPYSQPDGYFSAHGYAATPGIGDVALTGVPGFPWASVVVATGASASQTYALEGMGGAILSGQSGMTFELGSADGQAAQGPNAGGSGAVSNGEAAGTQRPGGAGGSGLVVVTEFCWGDRDQPVTEWRPPLDVNLNVTQRPPRPWPPGQPGPWWPPGWPPGWQPGSPWPPGWGPRPPWIQPFEGQEIEAGAEPYSQDPQEDP